MPAPATTAPVAQLVRWGRITEALSILASQPSPGVEARCLALECRLARGEMEHAIRIGEQLAAVPSGDDGEGRAALAIGWLRAATGHDEDALEWFGKVADRAGADDADGLPWRAEAALSLIRLGRRQEAEELAEEQLRLARAGGSTYATAGAMRTAAAVCATPDRRQQLREAHTLVAGTYERLAAQVATDLAGLSGLTDRDPASRNEAVPLLRGAEQYADAEDLWPLHSRIRGLLERLGETAMVPRSEALARLSEVELRIARRAAVGDTNRAIATRLGVSVKAVEWHLSHAYRKLDIKGRSELPRMLRLG